jgi:hypothetical protein
MLITTSKKTITARIIVPMSSTSNTRQRSVGAKHNATSTQVNEVREPGDVGLVKTQHYRNTGSGTIKRSDANHNPWQLPTD